MHDGWHSEGEASSDCGCGPHETTSNHLGDVNGAVHVIKIFHPERPNFLNSDPFQPADWQWRRKIGYHHIVTGERVCFVSRCCRRYGWLVGQFTIYLARDAAFPFPVERMLGKMFVNECTTMTLPFPVRIVVIRRWKPIEPWWLAERDRLDGNHDFPLARMEGTSTNADESGSLWTLKEGPVSGYISGAQCI